MKKKKIVLIDDDEVFSSMLQDFLEKDPSIEVVRFSSGEDFFSKIPDDAKTIILDQNLHSVSENAAKGMEILHRLKDSSTDYQVIMLSGQDSYGLAARSIMEGATEYVVKDSHAFERVKKLIS